MGKQDVQLFSASLFKRLRRIMGPMATDTVQQIKDRLSIQDVVSQYVKLELLVRNFATQLDHG